MRPKPQEKNEIVLIARHTLEQRPFLLPSKVIRQLFGYCLGLALRGRKVALNALMLTLDRVLMQLFDRDCERSEVMEICFANFARAFNRKVGRSRAQVFGPRDGDGATPLWDREAVLRTLAEIEAAPAELDLVERIEEWPGLSFGPEDWGKTFVFERPDFYFSDKMPEQVEITPVPPPGFEAMGAKALGEEVKRRAEARELAATIARKSRDAEVTGLKVLRRLTPWHLPKKPKPRTRRAICRASTEALRERARKAVEQFWVDHETARRRMLLRRAERDYCFPPATYWWRKWSDAICAEMRDRQVFDPP